MNAYLDNAASTCVYPEAVDAMRPFFSTHWGNPSSNHNAGACAREAVELARENIASAIHSQSDELFFTSGGTEADHLAIMGASALASAERRHIIVSAIEHQAVLRVADRLAQTGVPVTILQPDTQGIVHIKDVVRAIRPDTFLLSIMTVNNEVGTIQPIEEIGTVLRDHGILFHTDAVQAFGKIPLDVRTLGVDLMSLSAHKLHGPKGVGALFVRRGVPLKAMLPGGGQEHGLRSGTENVPAIVGFAKAAEIAKAKLDQTSNKVRKLREKLESEILAKLPGTRLATQSEMRSSYISNILFPMVNNSYLLNRLDAVGIHVTSGSACASHSLEPSHVLLAMGLSESLARSAIRFSLSDFTTGDEIDFVLQNLIEIVKPFTIQQVCESIA